MPDVRVLTAELEEKKAKAQAILDEYKTGMTAEKRNEFMALTGRVTALVTEIKAEKDLEESKSQLNKATDFLEKPLYRAPRAVTADSDGRKAIEAQGWEVKSGMVYAPTSLGRQVEMFPEEVLFGEIPNDANSASTAAYYRQTRAAMQPSYKQAYGKYLLMAIKSGDSAIAYTMLTGDEQKALSEGTDTAGGFLVPPDMQAEVLARVAQKAVIRQRARVVTTSRDVLRYPAVAPNATSGSIYSSAFVGGWVGETPAFSDTDPAFQLFDIPVRKIRVATKLSNDFIADSVVNILAFLSQNGAENMALVEDNGFIAGDGSALQPTGILNSGASTVDVEGSTTDTISNTTSNAGSVPKLITLKYALPAAYAAGASWVMARATHGAVHGLVDGNARPAWPEMNQSGLTAGSPPMLLGSPVYDSDFVPVGGTNANKVLIYGDLSNYIIAQRAQITTVVLRERFADTDQTGIILFERVGGALWNTDSVRFGIV